VGPRGLGLRRGPSDLERAVAIRSRDVELVTRKHVGRRVDHKRHGSRAPAIKETLRGPGFFKKIRFLGIILGESVDGCVWRLGSVFLRSDLMIHVELRQMRHDMDMSETVCDEWKGAMHESDPGTGRL
jgi:hypothetical protein